MMSATSRTALSVAAGLREDRSGDTFRRHCPVFLAGVISLVVVFVSTILRCYIVRIQGDGEVIAVATFISLPILAVTVPLLWLALARMATLRLRALVLAGFVFASSFAQERVTVSMARGDEMSLFAVNSCLIGLAVVIWLLSWIAKPSVARTT